jgi:hypothetical protein
MDGNRLIKASWAHFGSQDETTAAIRGKGFFPYQIPGPSIPVRDLQNKGNIIPMEAVSRTVLFS